MEVKEEIATPKRLFTKIRDIEIYSMAKLITPKVYITTKASYF